MHYKGEAHMLRRRGRVAEILLAALGTLVLLASCASQPQTASTPTSVAATAASTPSGNIYADAKLGFRLTIPAGWTATAYPGISASQPTTDVVFADPSQPTHRIEVGVFHGSAMPAAFAVRGNAPTHVGAYPAFVADTTLQQGRVPCLVRIFLAGDDYVLGEWCAMDASAHVADLERVLATYQPSPTTPPRAANAIASSSPTCSQVQVAFGYKNN